MFLLLRLRYSQRIHFSSYNTRKQNSVTKPERGGDSTFWTWSNGFPVTRLSWNRRFFIVIVKRELQRCFLLQTGNVNRVLNFVNRRNLFSDMFVLNYSELVQGNFLQNQRVRGNFLHNLELDFCMWSGLMLCSRGVSDCSCYISVFLPPVHSVLCHRVLAATYPFFFFALTFGMQLF